LRAVGYKFQLGGRENRSIVNMVIIVNAYYYEKK
jgi:hypothetical protein